MNIDEVRYAKLLHTLTIFPIMDGGLPLLEWNAHCGYLPSGELTFILELKYINTETEGQSTFICIFPTLIYSYKNINLKMKRNKLIYLESQHKESSKNAKSFV